MITIFVPVHNEEQILEKNIEKVKEYMDQHYKNYEIFIGNNGSTDKTYQIIKTLEKKYPKMIKYNNIKERAIGKAFRDMVKKHKCDKIITVDADLAADFDFIKKSVEYLEKGYDIIIGFKQKDIQERLLYRRILSDINIIMVRFLLGLEFNDFSPGAKSFNYNFIKNKTALIDDQTFYVTNLIYKGKKENARIIEIPIKCTDKRKSRFNIPYEAMYKTYCILKAFLLRILGRI